jgi:transposase
METPGVAFRAMIFYDFKRGLTFNQSHESLVNAFGEEALSLATVNHWFHEFQRGRQSFEDEPRSGGPLSAVTPENVRRVEELIREHRNITHREIQEPLDIG